ncbi:MAG: hypothetical protein ACPGXZ_00175 [Saprospiraceae bacterium]
MTGYYDLITRMKEHFESDPIINTITQGDIFRVDLNKQTIFPLVHIIVNNVQFVENVQQANVSVMAMDIVDISKDETEDLFTGNDNEVDVLNTQLAVLNRMYEFLRRGDLYDDKFQVTGDPTCEPFIDRFENKLAGWTMTFDVLIPNDMTVC